MLFCLSLFFLLLLYFDSIELDAFLFVSEMISGFFVFLYIFFVVGDIDSAIFSLFFITHSLILFNYIHPKTIHPFKKRKKIGKANGFLVFITYTTVEMLPPSILGKMKIQGQMKRCVPPFLG